MRGVLGEKEKREYLWKEKKEQSSQRKNLQSLPCIGPTSGPEKYARE